MGLCAVCSWWLTYSPITTAAILIMRGRPAWKLQKSAFTIFHWVITLVCWARLTVLFHPKNHSWNSTGVFISIHLYIPGFPLHRHLSNDYLLAFYEQREQRKLQGFNEPCFKFQVLKNTFLSTNKSTHKKKTFSDFKPRVVYTVFIIQLIRLSSTNQTVLNKTDQLHCHNN